MSMSQLLLRTTISMVLLMMTLLYVCGGVRALEPIPQEIQVAAQDALRMLERDVLPRNPNMGFSSNEIGQLSLGVAMRIHLLPTLPDQGPVAPLLSATDQWLFVVNTGTEPKAFMVISRETENPTYHLTAFGLDLNGPRALVEGLDALPRLAAAAKAPIPNDRAAAVTLVNLGPLYGLLYESGGKEFFLPAAKGRLTSFVGGLDNTRLVEPAEVFKALKAYGVKSDLPPDAMGGGGSLAGGPSTAQSPRKSSGRLLRGGGLFLVSTVLGLTLYGFYRRSRMTGSTTGPS